MPAEVVVEKQTLEAPKEIVGNTLLGGFHQRGAAWAEKFIVENLRAKAYHQLPASKVYDLL